MKKHNKADELLKRIFKEIAGSHFNDHKMISHYCNSVHFPRGLGDDISNWVQAYHSEYYHKERKEYERSKVKSCDCKGHTCGICSYTWCDHKDCKCNELGMR